MKKEEIMQALKELSVELQKEGIRGDIYLVGGAAMVVAYNAKVETRDIDAVFEPKRKIYDVAKKVAEKFNLPEYWLNDAVKICLPEKPNNSAVVILDEPALRVMAASPKHLLAMKLIAARREDVDDIKFLCERIGLKTSKEILNLLVEIYPEGEILPKTKFLVEELFGS
ncbi:MAG: DUF6036 family nucleotidyltransferase [Elusimicrobiota bacterium]|nr:DUF6036 family nucleotidyltransferase [Elusimicrobiota bacterium]